MLMIICMQKIESASVWQAVDALFPMLNSQKHSWRSWLLKSSEVPWDCLELSLALSNVEMCPSQRKYNEILPAESPL